MRHLVLAFFVALLACKGGGAEGGPCENGKRSCKDPKTSLYCANGKWQVDTCKGPRGCYEDKGSFACDVTANADGDPCPAALDGYGACRADLKSRALCKGAKYVIEQCKGADGCTMQGPGMSTCDRGAPALGETCVTEKLQACSEDGKSAFVCKAGKFELAQKCPGPKGCKGEGGGLVSCDPNGAFAVGDACMFIAMTCTEDAKQLLECKDGKFAVSKDCPGEGRCVLPTCDTGLATVGDDCVEGRHACSSDKKSLLACKPSKKKEDDGALKFAVEKPCKTSCTPKDGKMECL